MDRMKQKIVASFRDGIMTLTAKSLGSLCSKAWKNIFYIMCTRKFKIQPLNSQRNKGAK